MVYGSIEAESYIRPNTILNREQSSGRNPNNQNEPVDGSIFMPTTEPFPYIDEIMIDHDGMSSLEWRLSEQVIELAEEMGRACHMQFHNLMQEYSEENELFTKKIQYWLYSLGLDHFRFNIVSGGHKNEVLHELGLHCNVSEQGVVLILRLPGVLEGGNFSDTGFFQQQIADSQISWGFFFKKLRKFTWDLIKNAKSDGLKIQRLNELGQHVNGAYYYVFSVQEA